MFYDDDDYDDDDDDDFSCPTITHLVGSIDSASSGCMSMYDLP